MFDYGATHSFISFDCAKKLKLLVRELEFELVVSTPTKGTIVTSSMCAECPIIIEGQIYKINMICIPLKDLEVILGMDWLSESYPYRLWSEEVNFPWIRRNAGYLSSSV